MPRHTEGALEILTAPTRKVDINLVDSHQGRKLRTYDPTYVKLADVVGFTVYYIYKQVDTTVPLMYAANLIVKVAYSKRCRIELLGQSTSRVTMISLETLDRESFR